MQRVPSAAGAILAGVMLLLLACESEQLEAVRRFNDQARQFQIACLDVNGDGRVNAADAGPALPDVSNDGDVADDIALVNELDLTVEEPAQGCDDGRGDITDWQVSEPPALDCSQGERGLVLVAIGGGEVDLGVVNNAAGARWMVEELSGAVDVPTQIASISPALTRTAAPHSDAERWLTVFLQQRLSQQPCLQVVLLGHSWGGVVATAVASRLEEAGLTEQILLTVLIDRAATFYEGDARSVPQSSPVFNVHLPVPGNPIRAVDQPNYENWDVRGLMAPEDGEEGGSLAPVTHTTIDNSRDVLEEVRRRVLDRLDFGG